jgi:hypothetical protein
MKPVNTRATRRIRVANASAVAMAIAFASLGCTGNVDGVSPKTSDRDPVEGTGGMKTTHPGQGGQGGESVEPGTGGSGPTGGTGGNMPPAVVVPGITPLRRLTTEEYQNTVRDLLLMPDAKSIASVGLLPPDDSIVERFSSNVGSALAGEGADKYEAVAAKLAEKAVTNMATLVSCDPKTGAACEKTFIANFGKRAFRRPLTDLEVARYAKVFDVGGDFPTGVRLVVQGMLQSPNFLYIVEPVAADGWGKLVPLNAYAMATRLSYFLLKSMPDDKLFAAADANQLGDADKVATQAQRLMTDPRFLAAVAFFNNEWLELDLVESADKDMTMFPAWTDDVKALLEEQSLRFVKSVVGAPDGKIETLLTSTSTFMTGAANGALYDLYGMAKPATLPTGWVPAQLNANERAGILTHAGVLAAQAHENRTSFILRGKLAIEALTCIKLMNPPPGVDISENGIDPKLTARERSAKHRNNPSCSVCHASFDPLGFAFEEYDATGKFRTKEASGAAVDTSGEIAGTATLDGTVTNALDVVKKLGASAEVRSCVARQFMRFALARDFDPEDTMSSDAASLAEVQKAVNAGGGKFSDLILAVARSDAFRMEKVNP